MHRGGGGGGYNQCLGEMLSVHRGDIICVGISSVH